MALGAQGIQEVYFSLPESSGLKGHADSLPMPPPARAELFRFATPLIVTVPLLILNTVPLPPLCTMVVSEPSPRMVTLRLMVTFSVWAPAATLIVVQAVSLTADWIVG